MGIGACEVAHGDLTDHDGVSNAIEADLIASGIATVLFIANDEAFCVPPRGRDEMAITFHIADRARSMVRGGYREVIALRYLTLVCVCWHRAPCKDKQRQRHRDENEAKAFLNQGLLLSYLRHFCDVRKIASRSGIARITRVSGCIVGVIEGVEP